MSQAYTTSYHHSPAIHQARIKTLGSTLKFLVGEYREVQQQLQDTQDEVKYLENSLEEVQYKRQRLMKQNFSAAPHLQKSHTKYWNKVQEQIRLLDQKKSDIQYQQRRIGELQDKIPQIRRSILQSLGRS